VYAEPWPGRPGVCRQGVRCGESKEASVVHHILAITPELPEINHAFSRYLIRASLTASVFTQMAQLKQLEKELVCSL
jgi:hypothetical protein